MSFWGTIKNLAGKTIVVYADFIDPFCYIGFHSLWVSAQAHKKSIDWRGFEINPTTPPEGLPLITAANSDLRPGMWASVQALARQAGLELPEPEFFPNTRAAHALVSAAPAHVKNPLIERIYQAYFRGQKDIGQIEILTDLATAFAIPFERVQASLASDSIVSMLESHREQAKRRAFLGLPGYVFRGKTYFGALSRDAWETILKTS